MDFTQRGAEAQADMPSEPLKLAASEATRPKKDWSIGPYQIEFRMKRHDDGSKALQLFDEKENDMGQITGEKPSMKGGIAAALLFVLSKALVCYCSDDIESCAAGIDLGCVLTMGAFALASRRNPDLASMRPLLIETAVAHLFFEMVYNGNFLPKLDPKTRYRMRTDMYIHHISSVLAGIWCFRTPMFHSHGVDLLITECTTGLPMAFRQALISRKLKKRQGKILAAMMPLAFTWRCYWNIDILRRFLKEISSPEGQELAKMAPGYWIPTIGLLCISGCNTWWLSRIIRGVIHQLRASRRKKQLMIAEQGAIVSRKKGWRRLSSLLSKLNFWSAPQMEPESPPLAAQSVYDSVAEGLQLRKRAASATWRTMMGQLEQAKADIKASATACTSPLIPHPPSQPSQPRKKWWQEGWMFGADTMLPQCIPQASTY